MNVEDCLNKGLLKKIAPDFDKAIVSIEMAEHKLDLAKQEFDSKIFENAIVSAYTSMFHSARALLFKDGFKESSHFAVYVFLTENYSNKIERKYLKEFDYLRLERHELMYGLKNIGAQEVEAESAISVTEEFLNSIKKLVKK